MEIAIIKGTASDHIAIRRADGSTVNTSFHKKGPVPHDAVHFFVESELDIADGFWGMVARGRHPEEIQGIAKAAGHPSATRPSAPDPSIVPIVQAERIVECFEADLWAGTSDPQTFRDVVKAGCEQSLVPDFPISDGAIDRIRRQIAELCVRWSALPIGESCQFEWREDGMVR